MWNIDFSNVKDFIPVQAGLYQAKVKSITKKEGQSGYPYLLWELVIASGKCKGAVIRHYTTLKPEGLFNLRNTLQACGFKIPKAAVQINPKKIIGKDLGIEVYLRKDKDDPEKEYPTVKRTMTVDQLKEELFSEKDVPVEDDGLIDGIVGDDEGGMIITDDDL